MSYRINEVIGFDLGHGEFALTRMATHAKAEPEPLEINNKKSQITAVAVHDAKGILLGEQAYKTHGSKELYLAFKKRPDGDAAYERVLRLFVDAVYEQLLTSGKLTDPEHTRFYVGCPAEWTREDGTARSYQTLLASSKIPHITVAAESRAALMHATQSGKLKQFELSKGVLVIDVGSSTTDLTFIISDQLLDTGFDLGAGRIDEAILEHSLANHPHKSKWLAAFASQPIYRNRCLLLCRRAKEEYFNLPDNYIEASVSVGHEKLQNLPVMPFEPVVNRQEMTAILAEPLQTPVSRTVMAANGKSWPEAYRAALEATQANLRQQGHEVSTVLLTGGAARMEFIQTITQGVFAGARVVLDSEPELCIARGLARWGNVDVRTQAFKEEVNVFLQSRLPKIIEGKLPDLMDMIADRVAAALVPETIGEALRDFRGYAGYHYGADTLNDLSPKIQNYAEIWLSSSKGKAAIEQAMASWIAKLKPDIECETKAIACKHDLPANALNLPVVAVAGPEGVKLSWDPSELIDVITDIVGYLVAGIEFSLFGTALATGPIGILVALVVAVGWFFIGKEQAQGWLMQWKMPDELRRMMLPDNKIAEIVTTQTPKVRAALRETLGADQAMILKVRNDLTHILERELDKQADQARLLII